jgi:hypothetical protein
MPDTFGKICVCLRTRHEPLYDFLAYKVNDRDQLTFFENEIPDIKVIESDDPSLNILVVFDDLVMANKQMQAQIAEYFIRGRKKNMSCVYISQSYYGIPKVIRSQVNFILLKKISSTRDLSMILQENSLGMTSDQLYKIYQYATDEPENFLLMDLGAPPEKLFRKNLEEIIDTSQI